MAPVRWINGQAQDLGGPELIGYTPVAINKVGQILLHRIDTSGGNYRDQAAVWFNGILTRIDPDAPLAGPPGHNSRIPTAINNRGDVVGCGGFPFLWRQGVISNLNDVLAANQLATPNGNALLCPSAINDQGVILVNYAASTSNISGWPDHGWVRLTPLP